MSREVIERVFEPFFTTKSFGEGTGLGLSQVFGFAKQIGGAITVEFQAGRRIDLHALPAGEPRRRARREPGQRRQCARQGPDRRGRQRCVAELAAGMLDELGFDAIVTHSAKEALERLAGGEQPKLVFTDVVMPGGISGIELARKVRDRFPELPILLTTGYSEEVGGQPRLSGAPETL